MVPLKSPVAPLHPVQSTSGNTRWLDVAQCRAALGWQYQATSQCPSPASKDSKQTSASTTQQPYSAPRAAQEGQHSKTQARLDLSIPGKTSWLSLRAFAAALVLVLALALQLQLLLRGRVLLIEDDGLRAPRSHKAQRVRPPMAAPPPFARLAGVAAAENITKSFSDQRSYRHLTLPNKLQVLLISDAATEKAAAALDVNVGHFSDPAEAPGLAHFLEHMLFLGTEKYPDEDDYNAFLSQHGGGSNAYTSMEHTNYHFTVKAGELTGAIDRFAQFFIAPLFTESATARELNAIESENSKNLQNDQWRFFQLEKALSSPDHPFSKFGTGNKETLVDLPKEKGVDVRSLLLQFHERYYSANLMRLSVLGSESLDELETLVLGLFASVPNVDVPVPTFASSPHGAEQMGRYLQIVPVKDFRLLQLTWPLPAMKEHWRCKPLRYFGHLLGHESKGSVFAQLKEKGWVDSLMAGQGSAASDFSTFHVQMELTDDGMKHVSDCVAAVGQYIAMLRQEGVSERVWREEADVAAMSFRFQEKSEPASVTSSSATWMQDYPVEDLLSGGYLFSQFDSGVISEVASALTGDNVTISVVSQSFADVADSKERWYGTQYKLSALPDNLRELLSNAKPVSELHLPLVNPFIPTEFAIAPTQPELGKFPVVVASSPTFKLWHRADETFGKPKAVMRFNLISPAAYHSPTHACLTRLFSRMVEDALNEFSYYADLAGLGYSLSNTGLGLRLDVSGYSHKLPTLLRAVLDKVTSFGEWADEERFALLKDVVDRSYRNFFKDQPYQHATYVLTSLTTDSHWMISEYLEVLPSLTLAQLKAFVANELDAMFVEGLVQGNLPASEAKELAALFDTETLKPKALADSQHPYDRAVQLPAGADLVYSMAGWNPDETNAVTLSYFEVGQSDMALKAKLQLLCQMASKEAFEQLRTKEQLGYIVFLGLRESNGAFGLHVLVQSNVKSPEFIDGRIEAFLVKMRTIIVDMEPEKFESHRKAVIVNKLEKDKRLSQEFGRNWGEVGSRTYMFDRKWLEVEQIRAVGAESVLAFFDAFIGAGGEQRRKLAVHVTSAESKDAEPPASTATRVESIAGFKRGCALWPIER